MPRFALPGTWMNSPSQELRNRIDMSENPDADLFEPEAVIDNGDEPIDKIEPIVCPHCGRDQFETGSALLNTAGMTFLNLEWMNRSASLLICLHCSHIQWFLEKPEEIIE